MHKLNDTIIKSAKSKSSDYRLTDGNGLAVIVRKNGNKHWQFRYHIYTEGKRKEKIYSLGEYPALSVVQAREDHSRLRSMVAAGQDIQNLKRKQKLSLVDKSPTFAEIAQELKKVKEKRGQIDDASWRNELTKFEKLYSPYLNDMNLKS